MLAIVVLFLVVRLYSGSPYYDLSGDQCKYLTLGRNFPYHTLWNNSIYLKHPPPVGWSIGVLAGFMELWKAGLVSTILWATLSFLAIGAYAWTLRLPVCGIALSLAYIATNYFAVTFDTHVSRTPMLVCFTATTLLLLDRVVHDGNPRSVALCMMSVAMVMFVSDQSLLMLPAIVVVFTIGQLRRWPVGLAILLVAIMFASIWPAVRLYQYATHDLLPAGLDGLPESVTPIPWNALFQVDRLPQSRILTSVPGLFTNFRPFSPYVAFLTPLALISHGLAIVGALVVSAIVWGVKKRDRLVLTLVLLTVLFMIPANFLISPWYSIGVLVPLAVLLGKGASWLRRGSAADLRLTWCIGALAVGLALTWLSYGAPRPTTWHQPKPGRIFLLARTPVTRGDIFRDAVAALPMDAGIMTTVGLAPELAYLTGRRVISMPIDTQLTHRTIDEYDISVVIIGSVQIKDKTINGDIHTLRSLQAIRSRLTPIGEGVFFENNPIYGPQTYLAFSVKKTTSGSAQPKN